MVKEDLHARRTQGTFSVAQWGAALLSGKDASHDITDARITDGILV